jgi:hypothetical protein
MGLGQGGEMTQALYAHMNNKTKYLKKDFIRMTGGLVLFFFFIANASFFFFCHTGV